MQEKQTQKQCQTSGFSAADFLARLSALQDPEKDSEIHAALSSLNWPAWLKPGSLRICCLKMYPVCYLMTEGGHLRQSSTRWIDWGMVWNGNGGHLSDTRPPEIELEKEIEIKREIEKGHPARVYGRYQNVFLTDEELADLQASFPTVWSQYIEKLSEYMASTGKRYQNHAATIRRWASEDARKAAPPSRNRDYSVKEDETV